MGTVSDPAALERLVARLESLEETTPRRWGTLTAAEMVCHLADATRSVLQPSGPAGSRHPFLKWLALRSPVPWPQNLATPDEVDPHKAGTKPADFQADRDRAIEGVRRLARTPGDGLAAGHGAFGPMTAADWYRWAYRHTDHHLRQFGR